MITEYSVATWGEFISRVDEIEQARSECVTKAAPLHVPAVIYRGQCNAAWPLSTTLERVQAGEVKLIRYFNTISKIQAEVESYTGHRWDLPQYPEYFEYLAKASNPIPQPMYEYMVHLRHHGFPSPLLDWSESPYVAAFFAFRTLEVASDSVAIYAYLENTKGGKAGMAGAPQIKLMGPYVRSHRRHFLQKSLYTLCMKSEGTGLSFAPHSSVVQGKSSTQDLLWKIVLPGALRQDVLARLDQFNLNAYSLFGSEESLMESCAVREYIFRSA